MANKRFTIDGYGQIELNQVAFRRDGRIEAQCQLDATDFATAVAENGMLLAVDRTNRTIKFPDDNGILPIGLNYTSEHMYDERKPGLKNYFTKRGEILPRIGLLAVGDKWTSNCLSYDSIEFATDAALKTALAAYKTTVIYGGMNTTDGTIKISNTKPTDGPVLLVVDGNTTMPDGTFGIMLQVASV